MLDVEFLNLINMSRPPTPKKKKIIITYKEGKVKEERITNFHFILFFIYFYISKFSQQNIRIFFFYKNSQQPGKNLENNYFGIEILLSQ